MKKLILLSVVLLLSQSSYGMSLAERNARARAETYRGGANEMLSSAIMSRRVERVEEALLAGADVNARDIMGMSPLMQEVADERRGNAEIVRRLLAAGADSSAIIYGKTLPYLAAAHGFDEIAQELMAAGAADSEVALGETYRASMLAKSVS